MKKIDALPVIAGQTYPESSWFIQSTAPPIKWGNGTAGFRRAWNCKCVCGTKSVVTEYSLQKRTSVRCRKCSSKLASAGAAKALTKHGHAPFGSHGRQPTPTYRSWYAMIQRTRNPNVRHYDNYGGRGITVCEEWKDFRNFLADMGERPDGMTMDRIDVDGNYEKSNCRWADLKTQARNKRRKGPA